MHKNIYLDFHEHQLVAIGKLVGTHLRAAHLLPLSEEMLYVFWIGLSFYSRLPAAFLKLNTT